MKEIFNKDITLKVISALIAIVLWIYVVDIQNPEKEVTLKDIPIEITGNELVSEAGLFVLGDVADKVTLKIKGKTKALTGVSEQSFRVIADLRGLNRTGEHSVSVQVDPLIEGITILEKKPYYINVKLDKMMEIQKPVEIVPKGSVKDPYIAFEPQVTPNMVSLRGPSSVISAVDSLKVEIDLTGQTKDVISTQKYEIYNKAKEKINSTHVSRDVDTVQVVYPIMKWKEVPVVPQLNGSAADNYVIAKTEIVPKTVRIAGKSEVVDAAYQILADPININKSNEDLDIDVPLKIPDGLKLVDQTNTVNVKVDVERQISRTFAVQNIRVDNVPEDLSYRLVTKQVEVTVKGMESIVSALERKNIFASIDIKDLNEGQHEVPLNVKVYSDVEVVGSHTVTIKLSKQKSDGESKPATNTNNSGTNTQTSEGQNPKQQGETSTPAKPGNTNSTEE
ncbi:CdaR family protein [Petroclostridium sp. X23]|uniref:CdaR family protein n=1 Tax=Petroclostridium sp. X23 TaxID=3045146 RepID=UPI0024AD2F72|nr:CdaR family protein [Petroclostridium sp. X23]WHH61180.1 CdaR family protein [Petroclostridium sp. X23]